MTIPATPPLVQKSHAIAAQTVDPKLRFARNATSKRPAIEPSFLIPCAAHSSKDSLTPIRTTTRSGLVGRIAWLVEDKLVLRLGDRSDFALAGLTSRQLPRDLPPGRAGLPYRIRARDEDA